MSYEHDLRLLPQPGPERIDLAAIKTDLEFLMERVTQQPTRRNLLDAVMLGAAWGAGIVLLGEWLLFH